MIITQSIISPSWFSNKYEEYYNGHRSLAISYDEFLEQYCYFMTIGFKPMSFNGHDIVDSTHRMFRNAYITICKHYILHFSRKTHLQPFGIVFFDIPGTRHGAMINSDTGFPHVHGILAIHPNTRDAFERELPTLKAKVLACNPSTVVAFQMQPFDRNKGDFKNLLSYCSKAYHTHAIQEPDYASAYYEVYPNP